MKNSDCPCDGKDNTQAILEVIEALRASSIDVDRVYATGFVLEDSYQWFSQSQDKIAERDSSFYPMLVLDEVETLAGASLPAGMTVAMSGQTINRAADDVDFIAKRMKELANDRAQAQRNSDPEQAAGEYLDRIAEDWGEKRTPASEADYSFRQRLMRKIKGE